MRPPAATRAVVLPELPTDQRGVQGSHPSFLPGPAPAAVANLAQWVVSSDAGVVPDTAARRYPGRVAPTEGMVAHGGVAPTRHVAFVNIGAAYPNQTLSAF